MINAPGLPGALPSPLAQRVPSQSLTQHSTAQASSPNVHYACVHACICRNTRSDDDDEAQFGKGEPDTQEQDGRTSPLPPLLTVHVHPARHKRRYDKYRYARLRPGRQPASRRELRHDNDDARSARGIQARRYFRMPEADQTWSEGVVGCCRTTQRNARSLAVGWREGGEG